MLCNTELHNFNVTVRYRAYDAPQTRSWLGDGPEGDTCSLERGIPLPIPQLLETRCLLAPRSAHPPKVWQPLTPLPLTHLRSLASNVYFSSVRIDE